MSRVYAGKTFVERGSDGSFDKDYLVLSPNIITRDDRHWIYYAGGDERNFSMGSMAIGLATLRLDGFVYLEPWVKEEPCWVITKPFKLEGSQIEVNADARQGWLSVEVLDPTAVPIAGFSSKEWKLLAETDGLQLQPQWERMKDLSTLRGQLVRLKFHLNNSRLYSFQVRA